MSAIATELARRLDPVQLAHAIGLKPDPWQADVLRSRSSRILLNCCRQAGKTSILAIVALHQALYVPNSLALVVSASERQARELLRVVLAVYRALGKPISSDAESGLALSLENGSRVIVVPSTSGTIRGYANVGTLIVDEAARVSDETFVSVLPMLGVSDGRQWFYKQEYEATFMDPSSAAFRASDIDAAFDPEVIAWSL